jgi:hypothetical protein
MFLQNYFFWYVSLEHYVSFHTDSILLKAFVACKLIRAFTEIDLDASLSAASFSEQHTREFDRHIWWTGFHLWLISNGGADKRC